MLDDPNVDALIVLFVPPVVAGAEEVAGAIRAAVEGTDGTKPVLAVVMSAEGTPAPLLGETSPIAALEYPESAARALGALADRGEWLRRPAGVVPELDGIDVAAARRIVDGRTGRIGRRLASARADAHAARGLRRAARSRARRGETRRRPSRPRARSASPPS